MKRIGITGVSGYVGRELAKVCVEAGHEVVGFSRSPNRQLPNVAELRGNDFDLSGLDVVVNLSGEPLFQLWTPKKRKLFEESRAGLTSKLVEKLASEGGPKVLVSASGIGIYGDCGDEELTESSANGAGAIAEIAKNWEAAALKAEEHDVRVVRARIAMVLGPNGGPAQVLRKVFSLGLGGRLGSGQQWVSWIALDDLVRQLLAAAESESISGPVNCCSPNPVRNIEMTRLLGKLLNRPTILPAPSFAVKTMLPGMQEMLLCSQRAKSTVWEAHGFDWSHETMETALKASFM
ncbi:MAG: TIGR01777 family oxidoreductase [Verrucomicrobiota bacterium]